MKKNFFFKKRFHTSNNKLERPLQIKVTGLMKDELGGKIMRVCCTKTKNYSYVTYGYEKKPWWR